MVEHQIGHQLKLVRDAPDVGPIAKLRVHSAKVRDGETIIGCIGKKRQNVHAVQRIAEIGHEEIVDQIKRLVHTVHDGIAISDQQRVLF